MLQMYLFWCNNFINFLKKQVKTAGKAGEKKTFKTERNPNLKSKPKLSTTGLINISTYNQNTFEGKQLILVEQRRDVKKERDANMV